MCSVPTTRYLSLITMVSVILIKTGCNGHTEMYEKSLQNSTLEQDVVISGTGKLPDSMLAQNVDISSKKQSFQTPLYIKQTVSDSNLREQDIIAMPDPEDYTFTQPTEEDLTSNQTEYVPDTDVVHESTYSQTAQDDLAFRDLILMNSILISLIIILIGFLVHILFDPLGGHSLQDLIDNSLFIMGFPIGLAPVIRRRHNTAPILVLLLYFIYESRALFNAYLMVFNFAICFNFLSFRAAKVAALITTHVVVFSAGCFTFGMGSLYEKFLKAYPFVLCAIIFDRNPKAAHMMMVAFIAFGYSEVVFVYGMYYFCFICIRYAYTFHKYFRPAVVPETEEIFTMESGFLPMAGPLDFMGTNTDLVTPYIDNFSKFGIPFIYLIKDLRKATNKWDYLDAITRSLLHMFTLSEIYDMLQMMRNVYTSSEEVEMLRDLASVSQASSKKKLCRYDTCSYDSGEEENKSEFEPMGVGELKTHFRSIKMLYNSEFIKSTSRVLYGFMGMSIAKKYSIALSEMGLVEFSRRALEKNRFTSTADICMSVMDAALILVDLSSQSLKEGSLHPFVSDNREVASFLKSCQEIENAYHLLPTTLDTAVDDMLTKITITLENGRILMKETAIARIVQVELRALEVTQRKLRLRYSVTATRQPPFSVLINGSPGTGKTCLAQGVIDHYHKLMVKKGIYPNLQLSERNIYTVNFTDEYMSGFRGQEHWAFLLDDIAQEPIKQVQAGQGCSTKKVIDIINSTGMAANMAGVEEKGVMPIRPKIVVATTNTKDLNAFHAVASPEAILRRFPFVVTVEIKEEYKDPKTGFLSRQIVEVDGKLVSQAISDPWVFTFERVRLINSVVSGIVKTTHTYEPYAPGKTWTFPTLLRALGEEMLRHELNSKANLEDIQFGRPEMALCEHDCPSSMCPECFKPTSGIVGTDPSLLSIVEPSLLARFTWTILLFYILQPMNRMLTHMVVSTPNQVFASAEEELQILIRRVGRKWIMHKISCSFTQGQLLLRKHLLLLGGGVTLITLAFLTKKVLVSLPADDEEEESIFDPRGNIWASQAVVPHTGGVTSPLSEMERSLKGNIFRFTCNKTSVHALDLGDGSFITVRHSLGAFEGPVNCAAQYSEKVCEVDVGDAMRFIVYKEQVTELGHDIVRITCPDLFPRKNIEKYFPDTIDTVLRKVKILEIVPGISYKRNLGQGFLVDYKKFKYPGHEGSPSVEDVFLKGTRTDRPISFGDCGSLILGFDDVKGGWFIQGFLVAGRQNDFLAAPMSKHVFGERTSFSIEDGEYYAAGSRGKSPMKEFSTMSCLRYVPKGGYAQTIGSFGVRSSMISRTRKGKFFTALEELHLTKTYVAPMMKATIVDGEWINPWVVNLQAQLSQSWNIPSLMLERCANAYAADLLKDTSWLENVRPVSIIEAVNGIPNDSFANRLPMNTSGGFHFPGIKRQYFDELPDGRLYPKQEILDKVDYIKSSYVEKRRAGVVYQACLKDEAISEEKFHKGKVRMFSGCGVDYAIVIRQQFLSLASAIMQHNILTECAVGMNPYSTDWMKIYDFITQFGIENLGDMDYVEYDKGMRAKVIIIAFQILYMLCEATKNFSVEDLLIQLGIACDTANPIINFNGDMMRLYGSHPSGHPLTVIINSIVNSIYMRLAFFMLGGKPEDFKLFVALMTLGDDNVNGTSAQFFTVKAIIEKLASIGIRCTSGDKTENTGGFKHIEEIVFLKRKFIEEGNKILAPLALESIFKSLRYITVKGNISEEQQVAQSYLNARREWSIHGKEVFDKYTSICDNVYKTDEMVSCFLKHPYYSLSHEQTLKWVLGELELDYSASEEAELFDLSYHNILLDQHVGVELAIKEKPPTSTPTDTLAPEQQPNQLSSCTTLISKQTNLKETYGATGPYSTRAGGEVETAQQSTIKDNESFQAMSGPISEDFESLMAMTPSVAAAADVFDEGISEDADLSAFLERPIKIYSVLWNVGTDFSQILYPYTAFLSNTLVRRKLANYKLVKFSLELEFFIKGTKFHLGKMLVSHKYYGQSGEYITIGGDTQLINYSQRLSEDLDAGTSQGCCLCIPFVSPLNWIDIGAGGTIIPTNQLSTVMISSYHPLLGVGGHAEPVSITVFARAIDLKLAAPTSFYPVSGNALDDDFLPMGTGAKGPKKQHKVLSKDEYSAKGPVSSVASAVADASGMLRDVPFIGPFARATEIGANALGGIASLFGFSRPAEISTPSIVRNSPAYQLAAMEGADAIQKLSCTAKQEISVDPTTVGLNPDDMLSFKNITNNMTYIGQFPWDVTQATGTLLGAVAVTPLIERRITIGSIIIPTAVSFVSRAFSSWSGDMEYEIEVVGSAFHNGKIAVYYDPDSCDVVSDNVYNSTFFFMMDLSEERIKRFTINWNQELPYHDFSSNALRSFSQIFMDVVPGNVNASERNGKWYIKVVNELVVSDGTTPVYIIIRACGGKNLELMNPSGQGIAYLSPFAAVGGTTTDGDFLPMAAEDSTAEERCDTEPDHIVLNSIALVSSPKSLVFYGERIYSVRSLIKRYYRYRDFKTAATPSPSGEIFVRFPQFPMCGGPNPLGSFTYAANPWNTSGYSFLTYFAGAYGGWKGSMRYKLVYSREPTSNDLVQVERVTGFAARTSTNASGLPINNAVLDVSETARRTIRDNGNMESGVAISTESTKALEFEIPYATPLRYSRINRAAMAATSNLLTDGQPKGDNFDIRITGNDLVNSSYALFAAAGDDFSFYGYNGACYMVYQVVPP
jgi:hypothetical protein